MERLLFLFTLQRTFETESCLKLSSRSTRPMSWLMVQESDKKHKLLEITGSDQGVIQNFNIFRQKVNSKQLENPISLFCSPVPVRLLMVSPPIFPSAIQPILLEVCKGFLQTKLPSQRLQHLGSIRNDDAILRFLTLLLKPNKPCSS